MSNSNKELIRENRRVLISSLVLRKPNISQRRIMAKLAAMGSINPDTGKAWSLGIINADMKAAKASYRERRDKDTEEWIDGELAKLDELEGVAWGRGDYDLVLKIMAMRAKILGLFSPERRDLTSGGKPVKTYIGISPDDWDDEPDDTGPV